MASTVSISLDAEWTAILEPDATNIAIQMESQGQYEIHIASVEPDAAAPGITLDSSMRGTPSTFSASGLSEGASVWARSLDGARIVVMCY